MDTPAIGKSKQNCWTGEQARQALRSDLHYFKGAQLPVFIPHAKEVRSGRVVSHIEGLRRTAGDALRLQAFAEQVADLHLERAVVIGFEADPIGSRIGEQPDAESG